MCLDELLDLLKNAETVEEINIKKSEIEKIIPKIKIMYEYDQKNSAHQYDLWRHSLHTVINLPRNLDDPMIYLAALLHDVGKPDSCCKGKRENDKNMHYYGHQLRSMEIVRDEVIPYLDNIGYELSYVDIRRLLYYIEYHDDHVSVKLKHLRRHLKLMDFKEFQLLMQLQVADAKAHIQIPIIADRVSICSQLAGERGMELYQRLKNGE